MTIRLHFKRLMTMTLLKITIVLILVSLIIYTAETMGLKEASFIVLGVILFGIYMKCEGYE